MKESKVTKIRNWASVITFIVVVLSFVLYTPYTIEYDQHMVDTVNERAFEYIDTNHTYMTHTLQNNYSKNLDVMRENLKRGITSEQATQVINGMQDQFINASLYNDDEKAFINDMRALVASHFLKIDINIVR